MYSFRIIDWQKKSRQKVLTPPAYSYKIYEFVLIEKFDRVTQLSITSAGGVSTTRMHNNDDNACGGYFWKLNFTKTES